MNEQALIDFVCDVAHFNGKIICRPDIEKAIQSAVACGLLRADGNGRFKLTEFGRDHVQQRHEDEKRLEGNDQ